MLRPSPIRARGFYNGTDVSAVSQPLGYASVVNHYVTHEWRNYSSIVDRVNPIGNGGFRAPGPCSHLSISSTEYLPYTTGHIDGNGYFGYVYPKPDILHPMATPSEVESSLPNYPVSNLLGMRLAAWKKFHTVMPESVSIANFLYELKDFKDIGTGLAKASKLKSIPKTKYSKGPAIANSTFLQYNFAWAPFVGDLMKLRSLIDTMPKRLKFLRDTYGKPTRVHFRVDDTWSDPGPYDGVDRIPYWVRDNLPIDTPGGWFHYLKPKSYTSRFAASCTTIQEVEGLNDSWTVLKALYASLGLNNPLKIVWNAIPFSFMLDWIAPVGDMLGVIAANPFPGRWDVFDVTNSLTERIEFGDYVHAYYDNPGSTGPKECRKLTVKRYNRWLGLQLTSDDVEFSSLTNHQQRLFASLIAGNTLFKDRR